VQEQQARLIDSRETLFTRLQDQSFTRKITHASVPWMVARLGLQWYSASFRCYVIPIVQQVVVENHIPGIESHDEYDELRAPNTSAESRLLQKFQETCNNGGRAFRNKVRELVVPFFQEVDGKNPVVQEIKWKVFGVAADRNILDDRYPVAQALVQLPVPETDGPLCAISGCVNLPFLIECLCPHLAGECRLLCLFETEENASKRLEQEGRKPSVTLLGDGHAQCQKAVLDFLGELFVCSSSFPPALILN
jgi:hypothetical protein